jgi:hypothetical protein
MVKARDFWRQEFDPQPFTITPRFTGILRRLLESAHVLETFWTRSVALTSGVSLASTLVSFGHSRRSHHALASSCRHLWPILEPSAILLS